MDRLSAKAAAEAKLNHAERRDDAESAHQDQIDLGVERERLELEEAEALAAERIDLLQVIRNQAVELPAAQDQLQAALAMPSTDRTRDKAIADARQLVSDAALFPIEIASWQILIEMKRPKDRMGRFVKVATQISNEEYLTVVGRVLMVGPTAFEGKTESGVPLNRLTATISTPEDLVGKWIVMQRYTGNDLYFAPMPGKKLRIITITEILAVTTLATLWMKG